MHDWNACPSCQQHQARHFVLPTALHYTSVNGEPLIQGTPQSAGFDISCVESAIIFPFTTRLLETNIRVAIPDGFVGLIRPRSSLFLNRSLLVEGVVDSDYVDHTIKVMMHNLSWRPRRIPARERIAQLVIVPCVREAHVVESVIMPSTGRGGFGSTGK